MSHHSGAKQLQKYQNIVLEYLSEYVNFGSPAPGVETQLIADKEHNHYQLVTLGWQNNRKFVYAIIFHLDIKDGKVWVYQNNSDALIGDDLVERGISKSDIVLAFHAPAERAYTGFAEA